MRREENRNGGSTYVGRAFQHGAKPGRFSSHIPEDRSIEEMYNEDAENAKYEISDLDQEVTITGVPEFQKLLKLEDWNNAGFGDLLLRNIIKKSHFPKPRRIQAAVIPLIQNGWDIVGQAETGSGKTAAFVLPIINYIMSKGEPNDSKCAPIALILAPTRELVGQLYNQTRKFADGTGVTVAKAYGQYDWLKNLMELERGCNMLFATMGRLKDFVEKKKVKLHNISFFVLDEADRMLNQDSFQNDIMNLVHSSGFPSDRQTLLFSATFEREVQELAAKVLKNEHAFVSNGKVAAANPLVEQNFIEVTSENKFDKLIELLEEDRMDNGDVVRTLVFVQRKQMADVIALNLVQKNIQSSSISGDRVQKQREEALADFRKGKIKVLVATDVINYDMPNDCVTYVHRIGRTGRLHRGKATSFINRAKQDPVLIAEVVQVVREVQQIPPDFLLDIANRRAGFMGSQRMFWSSY
ncbi:DEAD/DEAH box helicase [Onchocerca flexuosa]|uniref:RNA helicase n=1 Tax=Onchocerca flexuosa TaxID=387005 RepID=A0A238BKD0_9BILA|nr:DEAD/DEAH box helicase [Onchocerca flexuosa]